MAAYLPADMITIIFSFLPVRFLLQFRSISKSWRFIIDSDDFKTLHFNKLHKLNPILVLRHSSKLYAVDLPTLGNAVPLKRSPKSSKYYGSCNGLLCTNNVIWNPSLCKRWILPFPPNTGSLLSCKYGFAGLVSGFGFDSLTGDYKLVEISYFTSLGSSFVSTVSLFSCRTNTWKILPNMPYALHWSKLKMGVFVDHALHWVVTKNREYDCPRLIVAFDLRLEVFNEVPLPELGEGFEIQVSQLGGCLSIVVDYSNMSRIDLWVMKQYGSKDGWFKLFTSVESLELRKPWEFVKPLGYSSDGMKVLFERRNELIWYNIKSKQVTHVTNPRMPIFYDTIIWVESFVQPPFPSEN